MDHSSRTSWHFLTCCSKRNPFGCRPRGLDLLELEHVEVIYLVYRVYTCQVFALTGSSFTWVICSGIWRKEQDRTSVLSCDFSYTHPNKRSFVSHRQRCLHTHNLNVLSGLMQTNSPDVVKNVDPNLEALNPTKILSTHVLLPWKLSSKSLCFMSASWKKWDTWRETSYRYSRSLLRTTFFGAD